MAKEKKLPRSKALAAKVIYAALTILRDNDRGMSPRELMDRVGQEVELDEWAKGLYKDGRIRWQQYLNFISIDSMPLN